jgi:DNA-binding MarR family transcriptional regulator
MFILKNDSSYKNLVDGKCTIYKLTMKEKRKVERKKERNKESTKLICRILASRSCVYEEFYNTV